MIQWMRRHVTAAGFLLTFALAWGALLPGLLAPREPGEAMAASAVARFVAAFAPAASALFLAAAVEGRAGLLALWRRAADWRAGWRWYALAYKGPTAVAIAALLLFHLFGGRFPPLSELDPPLASTLLLVPLAGVGQETGWRAFLLPRLQGRLGGLGASAVIGLAWGVWRIPFHLAEGGGTGAEAVWLLIAAVPLAVLFTWVWNRSGHRLLPVILLNASTQAVLTALGALPNGDARPSMMWTFVLTAVAAVVLWREGTELGASPAAAAVEPEPAEVARLSLAAD
jgi:uncharacterized protein